MEKIETLQDFEDIIAWIANPQKEDLPAAEINNNSHHAFMSPYYSYKRKLENCIHNVDNNGVSLLYAAVRAKKINIIKYLIKNGANINVMTHYGSTPICKAITLLGSVVQGATVSKELEILKILLAYRKPINKENVLELINFCLKHYKKPSTKVEETFNAKLFDIVSSQLAEYPIKMNKFFDNKRKSFSKYVAHLHELKGIEIEEITKKDGTKEIKFGNNLEGFWPHTFMRMRIRILLQLIVEEFLVKNENEVLFKHEQEEKLYNELLAELETSWITGFISNVKDNIKYNKDILVNDIFDNLSHYVYSRIAALEDQGEYILYSGWVGHAICVAFTRAQNKLKIRIDNLGEKCNEYHSYVVISVNPCVLAVKPRFLTQIDFPKTDVPSTPLLDYIKLLLESQYKQLCSDEDKTATNARVNKIYNPQNFNLIALNDAAQGNLFFRSQFVGNCVAASHQVGQKIRLGKEHSELCSREGGILTKFLEIFDQIDADHTSLPSLSAKAHFQKITEHFNQLLLKNYQAHPANSSSSYIMTPSLVLKFDKASDIQEKLSGRGNKILLTELFAINPYAEKEKEKKSRVVIRGGAGMGKTTLAMILALEWQKSCANQRTCDKVFYIPLRNLANANFYPEGNQYSLIDIVERECLKPQLKRNLYYFERLVLKKIIKNENVIWIIDGLDELYVLPHLEKAINELAQQPKLLITSRPNITIDIFEIDAELHFKDYLAIEVNKFVAQFFKKDETVNQFDLVKLLEKNQQLKTICQTPIILGRLCQLWQEDNSQILVNADIVNINERFINWLLKRAFTRQLQLSEDHVKLINLSNIKSYYQTTLKFSEYLAFHSLTDHRQIFLSQKLVDEALAHYRITDCKNDNYRKLNAELEAIGILKLDNSGGEFIHATFQEFHAAAYLAKSLLFPESHDRFIQAKKFISSHKIDSNYRLVLMYTAGLLGLRIKNATNADKKKAAKKGFEYYWQFLLEINEASKSLDDYIPQVTLIAESCYHYLLSYQNEKLEFLKTKLIERIEKIVKNPGYFDNLFSSASLTFQDRQKLQQEYQQITATFSQVPHILNYLECDQVLLKLMNEESITNILAFIRDSSCMNEKFLEYVTEANFLNKLKVAITEKPYLYKEKELILMISDLVLNYANANLLLEGSKNYNYLKNKITIALDSLELFFTKKEPTSMQFFDSSSISKISKKIISFFNLSNKLNISVDEKNEISQWLIKYTSKFISFCNNYDSYFVKLASVKSISWLSVLSDEALKSIEAKISYKLFDGAKVCDGSLRRSYFNQLTNDIGLPLHLTSYSFREKIMEELFSIATGKHIRYQKKTQNDYENEASEALLGYKPDFSLPFIKQSLHFFFRVLKRCCRYPTLKYSLLNPQPRSLVDELGWIEAAINKSSLSIINNTAFYQLYQNNLNLLYELKQVNDLISDTNLVSHEKEEILLLSTIIEKLYSALSDLHAKLNSKITWIDVENKLPSEQKNLKSATYFSNETKNSENLVSNSNVTFFTQLKSASDQVQHVVQESTEEQDIEEAKNKSLNDLSLDEQAARVVTEDVNQESLDKGIQQSMGSKSDNSLPTYRM